MHIVIATSGTHGDVRPFVALGKTLIKRGHTVRIAAPSDAEGFVLENGIEFTRLHGSTKALLNRDGVNITSMFSTLKSLPKLVGAGLDLYRDGLQNIWSAVQAQDHNPKADVLIIHPKCNYGIDSAEALGIPCVYAAFQPFNKTADFPFFIFGTRSFGRFLNRLSYLPLALQNWFGLKARNDVRKRLMGLPPVRPMKLKQRFRDMETLFAFSRHLQPKPNDWPATVHVVGFWALQDQTNWQPDARLQAFLCAGSAPVYIGFGSMPINSNQSIDTIFEAINIWGGRAIISTGWAKKWQERCTDEDGDGRIFMLGEAPHDRLFQHVLAVVHHGGAGSTAAGLMAGKPSLILPHTVDQPFWGHCVCTQGCGPKPISFSRLTPQALADALCDLTQNPDYAKNAINMAQALEAENALGASADIIENITAAHRS